MKRIKRNYEKVEQEYYFSPYRGEWREMYSESWLGKYTHKYSWDRAVKTFNEIRQNSYAVKDGFKVRGKRKPRNLPTYYDDPRIARDSGRSWKDFTNRRKQWG